MSVKIISKLAFGYETEQPPDVVVYGTEVSEGSETYVVFAMNEYGDIWADYMVYENGKWRWNDFEPDFWMIPPKLPK